MINVCAGESEDDHDVGNDVNDDDNNTDQSQGVERNLNIDANMFDNLPWEVECTGKSGISTYLSYD